MQSRSYHVIRKVQHLALGLCPRDNRPLMVGKKRCEICHNKSVASKKAAKKANKCTTCNSKESVRGKSTCIRCLKLKKILSATPSAKLQRKLGYKALKIEVFNAYGGPKCSCVGCTETTLGFMTIDHVNNDGSKHRKEVGFGSAFFYWLKNSNYPPGYRVLCFNCNTGTSTNGGICPHLVSKRAF